MKKYLLTALLGVFAFVGFASADNISISSDSLEIYSPSTIILSTDYTFSISDIVSYTIGTEFGSCDLNLNSSNSYDNFCDFYITEEGVSIDDEYIENCSFSNGDTIYINRADGSACSSIVLKNPNSSSSEGGDSGGSSSDSSSNTPLLSGGISQLTPVVTGIKGVVVEFIPYVVYISIGILLATLGFIVIKRLMNWMSKKITGTFSSRRRK